MDEDPCRDLALTPCDVTLRWGAGASLPGAFARTASLGTARRGGKRLVHHRSVQLLQCFPGLGEIQFSQSNILIAKVDTVELFLSADAACNKVCISFMSS